MAHYYANQSAAIAFSIPATENPVADVPTLTEFDKHRKTLLTADDDEGWAAELRRYLATMQREVEKDTDLVEWWQVSNNFMLLLKLMMIFVEQRAIVPNTWSYRTRCSSSTGVIRCM